MTRSGYIDDVEHIELYRASVDRALNGKRGQLFLREMAEAMDGMHVKVLIHGKMVDDNGGCCAIGSVCLARGMETDSINYDCPHSVGRAMGIAKSMAAEIEYMNDEWIETESTERRWEWMRSWVQEKLSS